MNTNAYRLGQLIVLEQNKIADAKAGIAYVKLALSFAFITTWILYFIFAFSFYVADLWGISTWLTENTSELVAFALFLTMALLMAQTLSMIKHAFYHHKAAFKYGLFAVLLICSLGVFMELFNSSSQQQTIAHQSAEKSKTFDSVANTQISIDRGANSSNRIAYLSGELAKAREYLNGCKKTCKTYQVKVADLTAQIEALQAGQAQANEIASLASTNAIKAKTEAMSALKEDAHKPIFKFIRDALGVGISTAVVIIACLVSIGFEYSHALLSRMLGEKLSYLESLQNGLVKLKTDYLQAAGTEYGSSELIDAPELPVSSFKYQQAAPFVSGFVSFKNAPKSRAQGSAKSSDPLPTPKEQQLPFPDFGGFKARRDTWATPELETEATTSNHQLGVHEEKPQQPPARGSMGLYDDWVQAVKIGECKPSVDPTWSWIQKRISNKETGERTPDRTRISAMQKAFFSRAMKEGLMIENPNYRNGGKKYLWTA
ncbi:hypothetical protein SAMN02745130_01067 [Thiothrix eikelboomii]|uniref:Uncharacterized protein n=1 Tax=Thiothrix eikelboomii TaxID=92487 RepID=A0A1T4W5V2_9GAMM|nr:hypothetical protein [Thiothrix eikelboomii]SKA72428.1 hypothetical protein SAMN02745130_01067 [Thiothrix eikelboomii]